MTNEFYHIDANELWESIKRWEDYFDTKEVHQFADELRAKIRYLSNEEECKLRMGENNCS